MTDLRQAAQQEPSAWRDMVVVSLVREGIDKHKARELADHFAAQPEPPPEWVLIKNILDEYGLQAISFVAEWKAAQRPWQGLTDQEANLLWENTNDRDSWELIKRVEAKLKERNT
jgi:cytochrome c553